MACQLQGPAQLHAGDPDRVSTRPAIRNRSFSTVAAKVCGSISADEIDELVLTSRGDITPRLHGEQVHKMLHIIGEERDLSEIALASLLSQLACPSINVAFGGALFPHFLDAPEGGIQHRSASRKSISHVVLRRWGSLLHGVLRIGRTTASVQPHQRIKS